MKKIRNFIFMLLFILNVSIITDASVNSVPPIANVYTEGIYHFDEGAGNVMTLELVTLDKPMTFIIIDGESNKMKYYIEFTNEFRKVDLYLDKPLPQHTTIIVGEGQLGFTFT